LRIFKRLFFEQACFSILTWLWNEFERPWTRLNLTLHQFLSESVLHSDTKPQQDVLFAVLGFSLYLADNVTWEYLIITIFKALVAVLFAWLFFLMLSDSIIKSIMSSVDDLQEERKMGGLLYHFIKPADNELIPKTKKSKKTKKTDKK